MGYDGIIATMKLRPSQKSRSPKDARYGDGQYFTDILPGTKTRSSLSRALLGTPLGWRKYTHYLEIVVEGLPVREVRAGVFLIPNDDDLDVTDRVVGGGSIVYPTD
jgi:hypothetical protein